VELQVSPLSSKVPHPTSACCRNEYTLDSKLSRVTVLSVLPITRSSSHQICFATILEFYVKWTALWCIHNDLKPSGDFQQRVATTVGQGSLQSQNAQQTIIRHEESCKMRVTESHVATSEPGHVWSCVLSVSREAVPSLRSCLPPTLLWTFQGWQIFPCGGC